MSGNGLRDRVRAPLRALVSEIRSNPPRIEEMHAEPTAEELARSHATLSTRVVHVHERLADALESIDASLVLLMRSRVAPGAPWWLVSMLCTVAAAAVVWAAMR